MTPRTQCRKLFDWPPWAGRDGTHFSTPSQPTLPRGIANQGYPISVGTDLIPNSRDRVVRAVDTGPRLHHSRRLGGPYSPQCSDPLIHCREVNRPVPHNRSCSIMGTACTAQGYSQSRLPHQCGNPVGNVNSSIMGTLHRVLMS